MAHENNTNSDTYKVLFMLSRDAIMTLEPPSWKFTSANPATVKMFGAKDEADFLRYPPWELSPKLQPDGSISMGKAVEMIDEAVLKGSSFFEWTHKRIGGEDFPAEVLLSKIEENGKVYLHALVRDITKRKELEKKIGQTAEEKFEIIFNNVNDGLLLAKIKDRGFILGNRAISKMLGYTMDELKTLNISDIHPAESFAEISDMFEKQARGELSVIRDIPIKRKDGTIFYADINTSSVTLDGEDYNLGVFRDVTERKATQEELLSKEKLLEEVQEIANLGSYVTDFMAGSWESSPVLDRIFGIDEKYVRNIEGWLSLIHPDDRGMMSTYLNEVVLSGKEPFNKVYRTVHQNDKATSWVHGIGKVTFDTSGHPLTMIGTIQDVTDLKNKELALQNKLEEIEKLNRFMVGREIKMADLKNRIEKLEEGSGAK